MTKPQLPPKWYAPDAEFSLAPFWFWNDDLDEAEITRQLDAFQAHEVDAFVIHPRVGLPRHQGWMSRPLLDTIRFAIEQAQSRGMWVILYDEGMYPSGSASGQVVAENPRYQCRGLVRINLDAAQPGSTVQGVMIGADSEPALTPDQSLVAIVPYRGQRFAIVDRPVDAVIRGLHFLNEDSDEPPEETPLVGDLLNPEAMACFIRLVYDRYYAELGDFFGSTIRAIFTDEPNLLGRLEDESVMPGTSGILAHVNDFLGYDFTPHLPALWDETAPDDYRQDYDRALAHRLQETYYRQLYDWCEAHGIALTGHPAKPDATGHMRYFQWPGQDIVWRFIEPDKPSALEGRESTQAKAAASTMLHDGRRRNANEFCGAYGHDLTFTEMRWLAYWLLIRGCNLLIPHAFYYSVRGPRAHERPPDVGLHSPWWGETFTAFAAACRRLCWLNTDSQPVCHAAILGENHHLPWRAARSCMENQIDFHYLDAYDLAQVAAVTAEGIRIADQTYSVLIVDDAPPPEAAPLLERLNQAGRVIYWQDDSTPCLTQLRDKLPPGLAITPECPSLRVRHVRKAGFDWTMLFNEGKAAIDIHLSGIAPGTGQLLTPETAAAEAFTGQLTLTGYDLRVLVVKDE